MAVGRSIAFIDVKKGSLPIGEDSWPQQFHEFHCLRSPTTLTGMRRSDPILAMRSSAWSNQERRC
jgi:hypothetical protein